MYTLTFYLNTHLVSAAVSLTGTSPSGFSPQSPDSSGCLFTASTSLKNKNYIFKGRHKAFLFNANTKGNNSTLYYVIVQLKNMEGESISSGFRFYNQSLVTNVTEQTHRGLTMFTSDFKPNTNVEGYTIVSL